MSPVKVMIRPWCSPIRPVTDTGGFEVSGFERAALIGGSVINSLFAKQGLITQIHLTLVPKVFGQGLSLFNIPLDLSFEFDMCQEIDKGHLLLIYKGKIIMTKKTKGKKSVEALDGMDYSRQ